MESGDQHLNVKNVLKNIVNNAIRIIKIKYQNIVNNIMKIIKIIISNGGKTIQNI